MRLVSSFSLLESLIVIQARLQDSGVERFRGLIARARIEGVPYDREQAEIGHAAWLRFGKGRSPAALNLGDCCSYALAKVRSEKLLYKGRDLSMTDIEPAACESEDTL